MRRPGCEKRVHAPAQVFTLEPVRKGWAEPGERSFTGHLAELDTFGAAQHWQANQPQCEPG